MLASLCDIPLTGNRLRGYVVWIQGVTDQRAFTLRILSLPRWMRAVTS